MRVCKFLQGQVICKAVLLCVCMAVCCFYHFADRAEGDFLVSDPWGPAHAHVREREAHTERVQQQLHISIWSLQCVKYMLIHEGLTELMINTTSSGLQNVTAANKLFSPRSKKKKKRKPSHINTESQFHSCYCEWREMWRDICPVYFSLARCESSNKRQIPRGDPVPPV